MEANSAPLESRRLCLALAHLSAAAPTETGLPGSRLSLTRLGRRIGSTAYLSALTDLLRTLNLIEMSPDNDTIEIPSVIAGYCLRVLHALAQDGASPVTLLAGSGPNINTQSANFSAELQLLAALEHYRLAISHDPQPLREVHAAVGFIGARLGSDLYALLFHWDAAAGMWQLPGGRYEERDGDVRQTLVRELAEELACGSLHDGIDVIIQEVGRPFTNVWLSPTFGMLTRTMFHPYMVYFNNITPVASPENRWITAPEIEAEQTSDSQKVDAFPVKHVLTSTNLSLAAFVR
jgi:hypothetical protein